MPEMNFGYGGSNEPINPPVSSPASGDGEELIAPEPEPIDGGTQPVNTTDQPAKPAEPAKPSEPTKPTEPTNPDASKGSFPVEGEDKDADYEAGTIIEIGDDKYTIDDKGNLVDKDGNIFKEAKDVKDFIAGFETVDEAEEMTMKNILAKVGVEVVDDDDKPIEFDDTPDGVAAYINSVIEQKQNEYAVAGVNKLIETYPFVSDVINYYVANGGTLDGFNQIKDRSGITINENNVAQQEAIVREYHRESGRKDNVDKYIQYLKDSGQLYDTAKDNLNAMIEADKAERERTAKEAEEQRKEYQAQQDAYWKGVKESIDGKKIAGYQIPDTIILNRDGKKIAVTPNDFFNYLYLVDENGDSMYVKDLKNLTPEARRDDELLRAYLMFTGGSYADLVNMAIKEKEVKTLKLKAIENNKRGVKVTPPTASNRNNSQNLDFGY